MKYAVFLEKKIDGVNHLRLDVILDTEPDAIEYCRLLNDCSGVRKHYFYDSVSSVSFEIENDIISRIVNIANCLNLAEICLMKCGTRSLEKSLYWFDLAKKRAKIVSDLLDIL